MGSGGGACCGGAAIHGEDRDGRCRPLGKQRLGQEDSVVYKCLTTVCRRLVLRLNGVESAAHLVDNGPA